MVAFDATPSSILDYISWRVYNGSGFTSSLLVPNYGNRGRIGVRELEWTVIGFHTKFGSLLSSDDGMTRTDASNSCQLRSSEGYLWVLWCEVVMRLYPWRLVVCLLCCC